MTNKLFIDGRDAFNEYGVFVAQQGYKQLIQFAPFKKIDVTDWSEEDGVEADLTEPKLDTRNMSIQFCITNIRYAEDLFDELSNGAYHTFDFREIKKMYRLRMVQNGSFSHFVRLGKLSLTFADDFPVPPTNERLPLVSLTKQRGYEIDGIDISQFGAYVLQGTDENLRKAAHTKENLRISTQNSAGVVYDAASVKFKAKDVKLNLLIDAPSIDEFWRRYNGLFAVVLQPETRNFYYAAIGGEYDCYYKTMSVSKFDILRSGKVWCEFSLELTFVNYRPVSQYMYLAHEDFALVEVLQDGIPTLLRILSKSNISLLQHQTGEFVAVGRNEESCIYLNE